MTHKKEYHKSDRIATAMCDAAGSDAEHAGMAVRRHEMHLAALSRGAGKGLTDCRNQPRVSI